MALHLPAAEKVNRPIRVAVYQGPGAEPIRTNLLDAFATAKGAPGLQVVQLSPEAICSGKLKEFDVLMHTGGSGGGQGRALEAQGRKEVREFVRNGGGYVGICAGAYLATDDYEWSVSLVETRVVDKKHWACGNGTVKVELSPAGMLFFGMGSENFSIHYAQGPLLSRREWDNPAAPEYESLGICRTGMAQKGAPEGIMPGTSAMIRTTFKKSRVFVFSPHPEMT